MLTLFVFDERESRREEDLRASLDRLGENALLWLALRDPTDEEVATVQEVFEFSDEQAAQIARAAEPRFVAGFRGAHACDAACCERRGG